MSANPNVINVERLDRNVGGDKTVLNDIYRLFRDYYPSQLSLIRNAIDSNDSDALHDSAHKLKGSLSMFHAVAATSTAMTLESVGRDGELERANRLYAELESDIKDLCDQVDELIASY